MLNNKEFGFSAKNTGGGGGNTVITDSISLLGNGTSGNVIKTTSAQPVFVFDNADEIFLDNVGIYIFNAEGCILYFNSTNFLDGARVLIVSNVNNLTLVVNETNIYYQGSFLAYPSQAYSKGIYEFVLVNGNWLSLNNNTTQTFIIQSGSFDDFYINYSGVYLFNDIFAPPNLNNLYFPDPIAFKGQKIQIINQSILDLNIVSSNCSTTNGNFVLQIGANSTRIFISYDGLWYQIT
jgi:hypothetical protein